MKSLADWLGMWSRYARLGWRLRPLAADRRSRWQLVYLGATTMLRSRPRLLRRAVRPRLRLGGGSYRVGLATRTELDMLYEIGSEDEYRPADEVPAKTIVDLGASLGLATLRLLSTHPGARVIAVEADPELVPRLRENTSGLPVTVVHAAICGSSGEQTFYRSDLDSWGNSLDNTEASQMPVRVPSLTLADLLSQHDLDRVDLLKMDIEGAEWEVLAAGLPPGVAAIIGEVHERRNAAPEQFIARLGERMRVQTISSEPGRATFLAVAAEEV